MKQLLIVSIFVLFYFATVAAQTNANVPEPENVLVVYNSAYSDTVALHYAQVRNIPSINIFALDSLSDVQITIDGVTHSVGIRQGTDIIRDLNSGQWFPTYHAWQYYYDYIASPIKTYLAENNLTSTIRYIVLCKGIPFKIEAAGDVSANANVTVESLLCLLHTDPYEGFIQAVYEIFHQHSQPDPVPGYVYVPFISNPYFSGQYGIDPNYNFNWRFSTDAFTSSWNGFSVKLSYLVSHLDAISTEIVKDMIDKSADPDLSGTSTWVLDDDPQLSFYSYQLINTRDRLTTFGFNVAYNSSINWITSNNGDVIGFASKGTHAEDGNCSWEDSAWVVDSLHYSWANGALYSSIESFNGQSLSTLKWRNGPFPNCTHTQGLATQFTEIGGTSLEANGWEPIGNQFGPIGIIDLQKTYPAYAMGYNLVDAMYQGIPYFAWVNAVVGDPLTTIAWGKQTSTGNITITGTNLVTGVITITAGDTINVTSGTLRFRHNGFIPSNESSVITIGSNVTLDSDSWDRGLLLTNNHDHPQLLWTVNPSMSPVDYYKIYRKIDNGSFVKQDSVTTNVWTDYSMNFVNGEGLSNLHVYYYVKSYNSTSSSDPSNTVDAIVEKSTRKIIPVNNLDQFSYSLEQNYPNPFNPTTSINYSIKVDGFVSLKIYNILGQQVADLVNQDQKAGYYDVDFNASNFPSGIYIYTIKTSGFTSSKKMLLIK